MPNFQYLTPPGGYANDLAQAANALSQAELDRRKKEIENFYEPDKLKLANEGSALQNKWYEPNMQSQIGSRDAMTNKLNQMTPLEVEELKTRNKFLPQTLQADIAYKNMGGGRGGAGTKEEYMFQNFVKQDNPNLSPEQIYEASNILREGGTRLPNGTLLNPLSPAARDSLDRLTKYGTTSSLLTNQVRAGQAEAEIPVADKYIDQGRSHYGDTINGYSAQMFKDSMNPRNKAAQTRLGEYFAADLLNFDKAALQTRIAGTESGVTIINEVMNKARQQIKDNAILKTDYSRKVALDTVSKALSEMLAARNKYGINASSARGMNKTFSKSDDRITVISPNGKKGTIPQDHWEDAQREGYKKV